jgi:hypothetical protein
MSSYMLTPERIHSQIRTELRGKIPLVVTFEKNSGEIRVMTCTTNLDQIPPSQWPDKKLTEQLDSTESTTYQVFDLEKQQWRSFRLDSIIQVVHGSYTYYPLIRD